LNHTNPALHDDTVREAIRSRGFLIAVPGERIEL
jgi:hypothetical protein